MPKLNPRQEASLVALHRAGEHRVLGDLFGGRSTVYRAIESATPDAASTKAPAAQETPPQLS